MTNKNKKMETSFKNPIVVDMDKLYKIDFKSTDIYIAAAMNTGAVFYVSNVIFNNRDQVLLYSMDTKNFIVSIHGGQDIKDRTSLRFLSDSPIIDTPTYIRQLFNHLDEHDCHVSQIDDDLFYVVKPTIPFKEENN